jgi:RNA polymerase sigma factor (TIGR02999 family)
MTPSPDTTDLLGESRAGNRQAAERLLQTVYEELRRLAASYMRREASDHTLQPTALVHEAFLRLVDQTRVDWQGRTHFKAVAAQAMRRALIDHARADGRQKRGGSWRQVGLDDAFVLGQDGTLDAVEIHEVLEAMRRVDERQARVAELRIFGGMSHEEIARALDCSARTVEREWRVGQAWLRRALSP